MIDKLILGLICLLPFGHFFFRKVDLWHGQGHFFQLGLLIIFSLSFFEKSKEIKIKNKSLGIFTLWAGLSTGYIWITSLASISQYPIKIFLPFFNILCFLIFYKLCLEYLDEEKIKKILKWLQYSIILVLFYCILQYLKLDEFLKGLSSHDELVGTIGNTSHLAGYLAIIQPIFFHKRGIIPLILLWLVIILAGSASGVFVGIAVILFWLFLKQKYKLLITGLSLSLLGFVVVVSRFSQFLSSSHRFELWTLVFDKFKDKAITGWGLGTFGAFQFKLPYDSVSVWRHTHNEFYQIAFEMGLIGLVLVLWIIWDYFKTGLGIRNNTCITLLSIGLGICLLSLFSFPIHLWQISVIGMFVYSSIFVIKNEVKTL